MEKITNTAEVIETVENGKEEKKMTNLDFILKIAQEGSKDEFLEELISIMGYISYETFFRTEQGGYFLEDEEIREGLTKEYKG